MDIRKFLTDTNKINTNSFIKHKDIFENEIIPLTSFLENPTYTQRLWHIHNKMYSKFLCKGGNLTTFINFTKGYRLCCSNKKCACREKSKNIRNNTILNKYNVKNVSQLEFVKEAKIKTCLKNYNVTNPSKCKHIQDKKITTSINKYGVLHPMKSDNIKEKQKQKIIKKYHVYNPTYIHLKELLPLIQSSEFWNKFNSYVEIKEYFTGKVVDSTIINYAKKYRPDLYKVSDTISYPHKLINEFLDSLNIEYITNTRSIISPVELDIYIPNYKLAIEINGVYWHSEEKGKDKNYHLNKLEMCEDKGIDLIHITDIDILNKIDIVKNIIKNKLNLNTKININECNIIDLNKETIKEFINKNSLFEYKELDIHRGLFYNNELVYIICLKKLDNKLVVTNHSTKIGYSMINELDILKNIKGNYVVTIDRNMFNKNIFENSNWKLKDILEPNFLFYKNDGLISNIQCVELSVETTKFWDCGSKVYIFNNN